MRGKPQSAVREYLTNVGIMLAVGGVVIAVAKLLGWSNGAMGSAIILALAVVVVLYPPMTEPPRSPGDGARSRGGRA